MSTVIKAENLGKKYIIGHQKQRYGATLRDTMTHTARGVWQRVRHPLSPNRESIDLEELWALKDINFEVQQGERVGIIGRNGAGKSTLLKVLSRITEPTTGKVRIKGRVSSLLEVGTGFHPELTGRENVFLNGAILGMTKQEIRKKFDEIVAFAELEKFLDTPVKRYSSGMYVRLAFAVAAHLEPEILIVDEVLAVGDVDFQKKCLGKMGEVAKGGRTVLFVSHNMIAIKSLCPRCLILDEGQIEHSGTSESVIRFYLSQNIEQADIIQYIGNENDGPFRFTRFWIEDKSGNIVKSILTGDYACFVIQYETETNIDGFSAAMGVFDVYGSRVSHISMMDQNMEITSSKCGQIKCVFERLPFTKGKYIITLGAYRHGSPLLIKKHAVSFLIEDGDYFGCRAVKPGLRLGPVMLNHEWICEGGGI